MALNKLITDEMIIKIIENIKTKYFTTIDFIEILKIQENNIVKILHKESPRNWRSVIGIALSRFERQRQKIKKLSLNSKTTARWKKL